MHFEKYYSGPKNPSTLAHFPIVNKCCTILSAGATNSYSVGICVSALGLFAALYKLQDMQFTSICEDGRIVLTVKKLLKQKLDQSFKIFVKMLLIID